MYSYGRNLSCRPIWVTASAIPTCYPEPWTTCSHSSRNCEIWMAESWGQLPRAPDFMSNVAAGRDDSPPDNLCEPPPETPQNPSPTTHHPHDPLGTTHTTHP